MPASLLGGIILLIISIFLIILGVILTVSLIFSFLGIPLIIIGIILLIASLIKIIFGTLDGLFYFLKAPFKRKPKEKKEKIIDVEKKEGVYQKK